MLSYGGLTWSTLDAFALCPSCLVPVVASVRGLLFGRCCVVVRIDANDHGHGGVRACSAVAVGSHWVVPPTPPVHQDRLGTQAWALPTVEVPTQTRWLMPGWE